MIHAVIMAGGSGTRFWPKSRRNRPKQLLKLHGDATMLQQTVERVSPMIPAERVLIVTGADQAAASRDQLPQVPAENVIAEPCPRDTAPCVGLAAAMIARKDPEAITVVMSADHVIRPKEDFQRSVRAAVALIEEDPTTFVTFGIRPTRPETGYGYIERGEPEGEREGIAVHRVRQFREKPDLAAAQAFVASGDFYWNSGIFVWKARAVLDALAEHRPGVYAGIKKIASALGTPEEAETIAQVFPNLERIPIDKAVMEKAGNVKVLETVFQWSDVGDWRSLSSIQEPDASGNILQGAVLATDTADTVVVSDDAGLIATLGVKDMVIIQSGGATLVAHRDKLDKLKGLVEGLGDAGFGSHS